MEYKASFVMPFRQLQSPFCNAKAKLNGIAEARGRSSQ
jgi:hypothetical protein